MKSGLLGSCDEQEPQVTEFGSVELLHLVAQSKKPNLSKSSSMLRQWGDYRMRRRCCQDDQGQEAGDSQ